MGSQEGPLVGPTIGLKSGKAGTRFVYNDHRVRQSLCVMPRSPASHVGPSPDLRENPQRCGTRRWRGNSDRGFDVGRVFVGDLVGGPGRLT